MSQLRDVLERAERDHIAVGHFNISDLAVLNGIVAAARELGVPVLVGVSEGERAFMGVRQVAAVVKSLHEETDCPIFSERADAAPSRRSGQRKTIRRSPRLDRARPDPAGAATHQRAPRKTHSVPPHTSAQRRPQRRAIREVGEGRVRLGLVPIGDRRVFVGKIVGVGSGSGTVPLGSLSRAPGCRR